jgi:hypothetical protein
MTTLADKMGMGPTRTIAEQPDGGAIVYITAPKFMGTETQEVKLTAVQLAAFDRWLKDEPNMLIQDIPDLSPDDRERLMSGLPPDHDDFRPFGLASREHE